MSLTTDHGFVEQRKASRSIAELNKAPIAIEAVRRIDQLFAIERRMNGLQFARSTPGHWSMISKSGSPPSERGCLRRTASPKTEIGGDFGFYAHFIDTEGNKVGLHSMG